MKYSRTYACGHDGIAYVVGPCKDRPWKIERIFSGLCPECYKVKREKEIMEAQRVAAEKTKEYEFLELTGTEKQILWANQIRINFSETLDTSIDFIVSNYRYLDDLLVIIKEKKIKKTAISDYVRDLLNYLVENKLSASFWINNRSELKPSTIDNIVMRYYKEYDMFVDKDNDIENEIILESTVSPEFINHTGVVKIKGDDTIIKAYYEKNNEFIEIVKSLGYKWEGVWNRKLNEFTGSFSDRAAELANILLLNGFTVSLLDKTALDKAVSGTYKQECTRWISLKEGKLSVWFKGKNDRLYKLVSKIPTARWDYSSRSTLIDIAHYIEVSELAEIEGFQFSANAQRAKSNYAESMESLTKVFPVVNECVRSNNGFTKILETPNTIIEDLSDE